MRSTVPSITGDPGWTSFKAGPLVQNWVTDAAPWRCTVPRQSAPVSPPPTITTCLPSAEIGGSSRSPCCTRFAQGRNSIAW